MKLSAHKKLLGFTLIELLVVITIISTLAVVVFVALNPAQRLIDAKNARRQTDIDSILTAIHQSIVDDKGAYPSNMPTVVEGEVQLGTAATGCAIATGGCAVTAVACKNLMTGAQDLTAYLKSMPIDPTGGIYDATKTGYSVQRDTNGIVTIKACGAEGTTIQSSR